MKNRKKCRKRVGILLVIFLALFFVAAWGLFHGRAARSPGDKKIVFHIGESSFVVNLYDNPTANDLYDKLPLTLTASDYAGYDEKVVRLPFDLSMENAPAGDNPKIPEAGYYEPGNWIAIYYGFIGYWPGKVPLGTIDASCQELEAIPNGAEIRIEVFSEGQDSVEQDETAVDSMEREETATGSMEQEKGNRQAETVVLNDGNVMPVLGLGTWTQNNETVEASVYCAIKDGYRLIDTAEMYGNELIYLKYLKAPITYDNLIRVETYPFPKDAVREALYNALVHSRWSAGIPIQVRIEDDAMYISNECVFPSDWTMDSLLQRHQSRPY